MAEMEPLPDEPTIADLARGLHQVHGCLEDHKRVVDGSFAKVDARFAEVGDKLDGLGKVAQRIRTAQAGVKRALSGEKTKTDLRLKGLEDGQAAVLKAVRPDPEKPSVAAMSQRTALTAGAIIGLLAAVPGILALVKFLTPLINSALAMAAAVH